MHSRNDPSRKTRNVRSRSSCSASSPRALWTLNGIPADLGGVWGRVRENNPRANEPAAATRIGVARASACSTRPITMPAMIHPIVPSTRRNGKYLGVWMRWQEVEFVSDDVGLQHSAYRSSARKNVPNVVNVETYH